MDENQRSATNRLAAIEYAHGRLADKLLLFQERQATGTAYVEALTVDGISQHVIAFRDGAVVYAGRTIPTPHEFIAELTQHMYIGMLDTVLAFAARRSSIQSVVRAMVEIGVLQWPQVTRAARKRASLVLEELVPTAGQICFKNDLSTFDLAYGEGEATGFAIDALLLEIELRNQEHNVSTNAQASRTKPVILSVDDSPVAQALIERTLGRTHEVLFCDCALDALNALNSRDDISMLLLDLMLPGMNGLEFCRMLRKVERYKDLPIALLTARGGIVERVHGRLVGASHYLTKPIKPADLLAVVALYVA